MNKNISFIKELCKDLHCNDEEQVKLFFSQQAKFLMNSRDSFMNYENPMDYLIEYVEIMSSFFKFLKKDWSMSFKEINQACMNHIISGETNIQDKERLSKALSDFALFCAKMNEYNNIISERLYLYEQLAIELAEINN